MSAEKIVIFINLIISFTFASIAQPIEISVSGTPTFESSLISISEAGNDFTNNTIESSTQSFISVYAINFWDKMSKKFGYRVTAYKTDINMHPSLVLEIKRGGNRHGHFNKSGIYHGRNWQPVTNTPVYFFSGSAPTYNIPVSYRIRNISVLIPADDFETTVVFTVYED
ncbi:hypothetical protein MNBD_BACTEROID01-431 [hydrothermal vent metagenome]|uniref:Uncharacterized protein n=1 Tax=hydrothermal vent metagenome TaxID=652676 RepID=A0A3B0UBK3_9ZZZZ